jgi:hypothetical protein
MFPMRIYGDCDIGGTVWGMPTFETVFNGEIH